MAGTDQLSRVFSALADPTRGTILAELAERDATVTELSAPFPMWLSAHLAGPGNQGWLEALEKLDATSLHIQATATDAEV